MLQPYLNAFKALDEKVVVLEIYEGSEYYSKFNSVGFNLESTPENMAIASFSLFTCDLEAEKIVNEEKYSEVNKLVIIAHGRSDIIQFVEEDYGSLSLNDVQYSIQPACNINILDIQACYCGGAVSYYFSEQFGNTPCIASLFALKPEIDKVYAWTGTSLF